MDEPSDTKLCKLPEIPNPGEDEDESTFDEQASKSSIGLLFARDTLSVSLSILCFYCS